MSSTTRVTVTLPTEQVAELKNLTDNVSGFVADAVADRIRHALLGQALRQYQDEHGEFTQEELEQASTQIFGADSANPSAA